MKQIKISILLIAFLAAGRLSVKAHEGMWVPSLIKMFLSDMQDDGLKLSAEDIYAVNKSSLKDAIVHFGGGCTAEVISDQGLILTNHPLWIFPDTVPQFPRKRLSEKWLLGQKPQ